MPLPPELTRIPRISLDVLRYMGQHGITQGDAMQLEAGTGMSNRGMMKAIRGLVTKGYFMMDSANIYHLTDKGKQAIQDVAAFDAEQAALGDQDQGDALIQRDLIVVAPDAFQGSQAIQVGLSGGEINSAVYVVLRLSALGAELEPNQVDYDLRPGNAPQPSTVQVSPTNDYDAVRIRVEALQLIGDADFHTAGGIFFDTPLGQATSQQAWYGELSLRR